MCQTEPQDSILSLKSACHREPSHNSATKSSSRGKRFVINHRARDEITPAVRRTSSSRAVASGELQGSARGGPEGRSQVRSVCRGLRQAPGLPRPERRSAQPEALMQGLKRASYPRVTPGRAGENTEMLASDASKVERLPICRDLALPTHFGNRSSRQTISLALNVRVPAPQ